MSSSLSVRAGRALHSAQPLGHAGFTDSIGRSLTSPMRAPYRFWTLACLVASLIADTAHSQALSSYAIAATDSPGSSTGAATVFDTGAGLPLVFVHGYPGRPQDFRWLIPHLPSFRSVGVALPGLDLTPLSSGSDPSFNSSLVSSSPCLSMPHTFAVTFHVSRQTSS